MKFLKYLGVMGIASFAYCANAQSVLSVDNFSVSAGDPVDVEILYSADAKEINAMNFDIILPAALTLDDITLTSRTKMSGTKKWDFNVDDSNPGYLRVIGSNIKPEVNLQPGTNGAILILSFVASANYSGDLSFTNVVASGPAGGDVVKFKIGTVGKKGYSTYSSNGSISTDLKITGATPYYGVVSGSTLQLQEAADDIVLAGEGVVLKGVEGASVYATNAVATDLTPTNELKGTVNGATVTPSSVHVLSTVSEVPGFYLYSGSFISLAKAYLEGVSPARVTFEEETGIQDVTAEDFAVESVYNLQGQKLNEVKKGFNIVNGKKVMY